MPAQPQLVIRDADGAVQRVGIAAGRHVLGRDPDCDVVIRSQEVSRRHARLEVATDHFVIEDLGSTSGTYVLGRLLKAPQRLAMGHSFQLGTVTVEVVAQAGPTPAGGKKITPSPAKEASEERYAQGTELGRGGMGVVRQTEDLKLGRHVAMKVMLETHKLSFDARLRFYQEAEILARLEHPNIVPMHDLGIDANGRPYYTMKEVKGVTLQRVLTQIRKGDSETIRKHPLGHLLGIFQKVCDGVSFAHSKGIVHRDLKPENVMLGEFGEVLVMDWGLAKDLKASASLTDSASGSDSGTQSPNESGSGLTMDGAVMGTPQYMPPEQAEGRLADIDERSDVFSLGAVLYAILTLHPPVKGQTVAEVLENVKSGNISPPTSYNPGGSAHKSTPGSVEPMAAPGGVGLPHCPGGKVPGALSAVAMRALALDQEDRYQSISMLAADVEDYLAGRATSAEEAGQLKLLWLSIQRNKAWLYPVAGAFVLVVIIALSLMGKIIASGRTARLEAEKARQAEKLAEAALSRSQISLAEAAFRNGDVTAMVKALEACPEELRDDAWRYFWAKRDGGVRTLSVLSGRQLVQKPVPIPSRPGHFAVILRNQSGVTIVDALNNRIADTFKTAGEPNAITVSGDGKVLCIADLANGTLTSLDPLTGATRNTLTVEKVENEKVRRSKAWLSLNHDGSMVALSFTGNDNKEQVFEIATGKVRLSRTLRNTGPPILLPDGESMLMGNMTARSVHCINLDSGKERYRVEAKRLATGLSPDGKMLAAGTHNGLVLLLDPATGTTLKSLAAHKSEVMGLAWARDGRLITVGNEGQLKERKTVLKVWDIEQSTPLATLFGFAYGEAVTWSFDMGSGTLVTDENPPRLWRVPVGLEQKIIAQVAEQAWSIAFASDERLLARVDYELGLHPTAGSEQGVTGLTGAGQHRVGATHPGKRLVAVGASVNPANPNNPRDIRIYELKEGVTVLKPAIPIGRNQVDALQFDKPGERLLATLRGGVVEAFSLASGQSVLRLEKPRGSTIQKAAFASDRHIVAFAKAESTAMEAEYHLLRYGENGKLLQTVTNRFQIYDLAVAPDGKTVAIAGSDQSISLYQTTDLKHLRTFRAHDEALMALAFHPIKPQIASASIDHTVKIWDYEKGELKEMFFGPLGAPVAIAFSPSGNLLAADGQDNFTRIWRTGGSLVASSSTSPVTVEAPSKKKRKKK